MSSGWIAFLTVVVLIGAGGFILYRTIKRRLEKLSMQAFGTKSIVDGINRQADILAETPKSVSAMTRIFEPQIMRDFPDFHLDQYKNKVENLLISAFRAVTEMDSALLPVDVSEELRNQVENRIAGNLAAGTTEVYSGVEVHQTEISNYEKRDGKCVITFQSAVGHCHYKEKNNTLIEGDKERRCQTKYNIEVMYIQDEKLAKTDNAVGTTCPNCGAPVTKLGNMYCEYCGLAVTPVNLKVWTLHRYYEVDYHHV